MLPGFASLVEERILKAQQNGELDNLPGRGKPLNLDDMAIPEEFRMAHRVLKNSGFLPPEVEIRNQIKKIEDLLQAIENEGDSKDPEFEKRRAELNRKLNFLITKLNTSRGGSASGGLFSGQYREKMLKRIL